jgi:hypothetical protein
MVSVCTLILFFVLKQSSLKISIDSKFSVVAITGQLTLTLDIEPIWKKSWSSLNMSQYDFSYGCDKKL